MAQSAPNSSNPLHRLPPSARPPCPTCSCPQAHFQQLPEIEDPRTVASGPSISTTDPTLKFPQPQLPASALDPPPVSSAPAPPVSTAVAPAQPPSSNPNCFLEPSKYKNRLQEYTQRSSIPLPEYITTNEGLPHAPRFRSSVEVDGVTYTSPITFSHRKTSEQDAAKHALEHISKKIKDEGSPLIHGDTVFCKSILNEFAVKMNIPTLTYNTIQSEALIPVFVSSLVFNGKTYTGEPGKSKKEAEQLAARAAILYLMGNSGFGTALSEIIKSKGKLFDALYKVKYLNYFQESIVGGSAETGCGSPHTQSQVVEPYVPAMCWPICAFQEASVSATREAFAPVVSQPVCAIPNECASVHPPNDEFRVAKQEISSGAVNPSSATVQQRVISFIPQAQQPVGTVPNLRKKRRRKNKKARIDAQDV